MALFSEPFSVPDDLADGWDDMVRRNRLIQTLNDPGFADDGEEPVAAPNDVSGQLRQAQMPMTDWLAMRSDQLKQDQATAPGGTGQDGDDTISATGGSDQLVGGPGNDTASAPNALAGDAKRAAARDYGAHYIMDFVPRAEGTSSYDASYNNGDGSGKNYPVGWKKPTELTVDQAIQMAPDLKRVSGGNVIGLYQFKPGMLGDAKQRLNLTGSELLTPGMQDRIMRDRLSYRGYDAYLSGGAQAVDDHTLDLDKLQNSLAQEWPSLADSTGQPHFDGEAVRSQRVTSADVKSVLRAAVTEADGITNR
jgi:hypothetical protein